MGKAYCVKCKASTEQVEAKRVEMEVKGAKRARMAGKCEKCGTKTSLFLKTKDSD